MCLSSKHWAQWYWQWTQKVVISMHKARDELTQVVLNNVNLVSREQIKPQDLKDPFRSRNLARWLDCWDFRCEIWLMWNKSRGFVKHSIRRVGSQKSCSLRKIMKKTTKKKHSNFLQKLSMNQRFNKLNRQTLSCSLCKDMNTECLKNKQMCSSRFISH